MRGAIKTWSVMLAGVLAAAATSAGAGAGVASVDAPHPDAPPETRQFDFLVGPKECTTRRMQPDGSLVDGPGATWTGRYILGGWAIEDLWISTLPNGKEFQGVNYRSFNPETSKWDNRWLPTGNLKWSYFEAEQVDDTMVMIGGGGEDARGTFIDRNVFSEATRAGFKWRKDRSWDGGENWIQGVGMIDCRAVESQG